MGITAEHEQAATPAWLTHVEQTEGWLSADEARLLHDLASGVTRGCIVEIGAYRGRSTIALSAGAPDGIGVHSIDPHAEMWIGERLAFRGPEDRRAFFESMIRSGAWRNVSLLNSTSAAIAPGWNTPVEMLWIDGDHSHRGVRADWDAWQPHLLRGAAVVFDDAHDPAIGPQALIGELLESGTVEHIRNVGKVRAVRFCGV
ncbi:MAG: class I SAM-dependent methyltransferase [Planctomycetota bacterium]